MRINTNVAALNTIRMQDRSDSALSRTLQRLSSGSRVNSAADDAAGLAIGQRFTSQIRGTRQAVRNANDAVSMLQTAEGSLGELANILQRGRELSLQAANATNSPSDRASLQTEIDQLVQEINRIGSDTSFNGIRLFQGAGTATANVLATETVEVSTPVTLAAEKQQILDNLQRSWLAQSEDLIQNYFGLTGTNVELKIVLDDDIPGASAFVTGTGSTTLMNLELHIDVNEFINVGLSWPNDTLDQLIAHEMTHAVMAATTNIANFDKWFTEGTAELLPGGDLRLNAVLNNLVGEGPATEASVVANIDNVLGQNFQGRHLDYATAYVATRYLHSEIIAGGSAGGVKDMLAFLSADTNRTLDDYFATGALAGIADSADFVADFKTNGEAFITGQMDLADGALDIGAIGGFDADGGARDTSAAGTVADVDNPTTNPLEFFTEIFPDLSASLLVSQEVTSQIGLSTSSTLNFRLGDAIDDNLTVELRAIQAAGLDLEAIDISADAQGAVQKFGVAIDAIAAERARLGAIQNRLGSTIASLETTVENVTASRSRVLDADFAVETAQLTRTQIVRQASSAMLVQANSLPRMALQLLAA